MIFRLRTSQKTMTIFTELQKKTNLKPFALSKIAIALSLKEDQDSLRFDTDTNGLDLNKQTITGKYDNLYKCLMEQHCGYHLTEEDYFPKYVKAHLDRGAVILHNEFRYAKDLISYLAGLEGAAI
ncbi:DndE family protein [Sporomusa termitida]|uniref:DNA sulfur modification protein DndE n=1 Tax=Sporomusa termitida TaxID=2377 RepID=A0A517DWS3_9FIRM|nr:DndE family protein [Sporomusa termitida]QDR81808.1 DNA sulfur modification protein DndE [Sporomusa termitida]